MAGPKRPPAKGFLGAFGYLGLVYFMASKTYRNKEPQRRIDGSDVFNQAPHWTILDHHMLQTYPAYREREKTALKGEYVDTSYYQAIYSGRRCSCWGTNTAAAKNCRICYGRGIVGGWLKYGTEQWILDATTPDLTMTNVQMNTAAEGPLIFSLTEEADYGEIEAPGTFNGCAGAVDMIDLIQWDEEGKNVAWYIQTVAAPDWIPLTRDNVYRLLGKQPQIFRVKATLRRPSTHADSPLIAKCHLRIHRTKDDETRIRINRPRMTHQMTLAELGVTDDWATQRWWLDATLPNVTDQDWFYERTRQIRWKVTDTDKMAPQNYLLAWDITLRKTQDWEGIGSFPL